MATIVETNGTEQVEWTEADFESLETESLTEGLESELGENLESVSTESVAEDVEALMEGNFESRTPSNQVNQQLTKVFTVLIKNAVKKIASNSKTRAKLQAACRKGPDAVSQLLTPIITKTLPTYFGWMPAIFVPAIVARLFPAICKQAGLKSEEVAAVAEAGANLWFGGIGAGAGVVGALLAAIGLIPAFKKK